MVSLSEKESVQSRLARFRHTLATHSTVPSRAPTVVMVATDEQPSPPTQSREVVRYDPSSQHQTRSQQKRIAAAEGGNLEERLNLITIEAAEAGLAQRFCKHTPDRSLLEYLREPGDGIAPHEAVATVLEDLVDETAEVAGGLPEVVRYMQVHKMWNTHPDRRLRSAEAFMDHLDRAGFIRGGLVYATTAHAAKATSIRRIDARWGPEWFRNIPADIRDERWSGPGDLSKNILARIASTAEMGRSLQTAVSEWREAIQRRNDVGNRRNMNIKGKITPFLALADVRVPQKTAECPSTIDDRPAHEMEEERLQVELIPRQPIVRSPARAPTYVETAQSKTPRKRKRASDVVSRDRGEDGVDDEGWRKSKDGRWLTKRIKNQFIRKPVEEVEETESGSTLSDHDDDEEVTPSPSRTRPSPVLVSSGERADSAPTSRPVRSPPNPGSQNCAGPVFLRVIRGAIKSFTELEDPDYIKTRVCDCCRESVTATVHSILHEARTGERMLGAIGEHLFGTRHVPPRQEALESPKRPHRWNTLFVGDDSQSEDSE